MKAAIELLGGKLSRTYEAVSEKKREQGEEE